MPVFDRYIGIDYSGAETRPRTRRDRQNSRCVTKLPQVSGARLVRTLARAGFREVHRKPQRPGENTAGTGYVPVLKRPGTRRR